MKTFSLNPATVSALHLTRSLPAAPSKVMKAWTDEKQLAQWWASDGFRLKSVTLKPKTGGEFRFEYENGLGEPSAVYGTFQDASSEMLVFSWAREGKKADIGGTLVTVEFRKGAKGTELALTHELLPNSAVREAHRTEWLSRLERLGKLLG
ncbi:MAG: SRPBCC domain-containing protein [Myxococcota bacterium]|nr:SRPBCC domain-containing protein [Myxococcota bacterium]